MYQDLSQVPTDELAKAVCEKFKWQAEHLEHFINRVRTFANMIDTTPDFSKEGE